MAKLNRRCFRIMPPATCVDSCLLQKGGLLLRKPDQHRHRFRDFRRLYMPIYCRLRANEYETKAKGS
jgi:hypothetical protein